MKQQVITVVRLYLSEGEKKLDTLLKYLHQQNPVKGVTVFRGIYGFGPSGKVHETKILEMSLDLPLVVEFFDDQQHAEEVVQYLAKQVAPEHIITWEAKMNIE